MFLLLTLHSSGVTSSIEEPLLLVVDLSDDPLVDLVFTSITLFKPRFVRVAAGVDAGVLTATVVFLAERDRKKVRAFTNLAL